MVRLGLRVKESFHNGEPGKLLLLVLIEVDEDVSHRTVPIPKELLLVGLEVLPIVETPLLNFKRAQSYGPL